MGQLIGHIRDSATGEAVAAQVHVRLAGGRFVHPEDAILKEGPGHPFFYADGEFRINVGRGKVQLLVERGTEFIPLNRTVECTEHGITEADLELKRWTNLPDKGWFPGNTHLHYRETETRPDERLSLDPRVYNLRLTVISIAQRRELRYASNKYPIGLMNDYTSAHHLVDCGEENRHNVQPSGIGYGHIMLLRLRNQVDPVSRGMLVNDFDPDYPPLCYACDDAHRQGGIVIWCHNGRGMEAPVAAVLGKLDAFNLFDPCWMDPEYDIWYALLNCGIPLPASTGSDWFLSSNNRVYVQTGSEFTYDGWLSGLRDGRSFITNGPALTMVVNGHDPGAQLELKADSRAQVSVSWHSHYPLTRIDIIQDGEIAAFEVHPEGTLSGKYEADLPIAANSWIAARCGSDARDSFFHAIYAHTSPVYIRTGKSSSAQRQAAGLFVGGLDESLGWIRKKGRFTKDEQREEMEHLFQSARSLYKDLSNGKEITTLRANRDPVLSPEAADSDVGPQGTAGAPGDKLTFTKECL